MFGYGPGRCALEDIVFLRWGSISMLLDLGVGVVGPRHILQICGQ